MKNKKESELLEKIARDTNETKWILYIALLFVLSFGGFYFPFIFLAMIVFGALAILYYFFKWLRWVSE
jgi:hypothetical protein